MYNDLRDDIAQCVIDTARVVGQGAANRLNMGSWKTSVADAVWLIKEKIRSVNGGAHGADIHWNKGRSLEAIVLDPKYAHLFNDDDAWLARKTLDI